MDDSECLLPLELDLMSGAKPASGKAHAEHLETLRQSMARALMSGASPEDYGRLQASLGSVEAGIEILHLIQKDTGHA